MQNFVEQTYYLSMFICVCVCENMIFISQCVYLCHFFASVFIWKEKGWYKDIYYCYNYYYHYQLIYYYVGYAIRNTMKVHVNYVPDLIICDTNL